MMAAAQRLDHSLHHPIRRDHVFPDRTNPLDIHDDIELFQRFRFRCRELPEVIDNFKDDVTFKLKSPPHTHTHTLSMVRGTVPVVFKASVMFVPLWLSSDLSQHSCVLTEAGSCNVCSCIWVKIMAQSYPSRLLRRKNKMFTPDVEGNSGRLPVTVKYRRPWDIAVL